MFKLLKVEHDLQILANSLANQVRLQYNYIIYVDFLFIKLV